MSVKCGRVFGSIKRLITPERNRFTEEIIKELAGMWVNSVATTC
jgi:hypothetical protein